MKKIEGPYGVLMTPFDGDSVDIRAFAEQVRKLNNSGIRGYVTNGSTSEFIQLSLEEQMNLSRITAMEKSPDKKLVVSACTGNLADTVRICEHAEHIGADAVLVCPPYYFKYTAKEREEYFMDVADLSPVPVILYNIPFFTQELELEVIFRLLEHKNIIGIKDSSANMKRLEHMIEKTKDSDVSILTGTDDILLPALVGGCVGSFTAFGAIFPNEVTALYRAVEEGDLKKAKEIQFKFMPLLRIADSFSFPKGYKYIMSQASGIEFKDKEIK